MYISEEQKILEKIDADFRTLLANAKTLAKNTEGEITDWQQLEYMDLLDEVKREDFQSENLEIEANILLKGEPENEVVFIPKDVTEIGNEAFNSRELQITKIIFPNGLKKINDSAFADRGEIYELCVKDPDLCYPAEAVGLVGLGDEIDQFSKGFSEFPETLEEIGDKAFRSLGLNAHHFHKKSIKYLVLPKSLRKIGRSAFFNSGIEAVYFNGAETISVSCFQSCRSLTKVIMSDDVKRIDSMAFDGCNRLKETTFSKRLQEICDLAFAGCFSLEQITLPDGLEKIGKMAFVDCAKLADIHIPASVMDIASDAFCNCPEVVIHSSTGSYAEQFAKENNIKFEAI